MLIQAAKISTPTLNSVKRNTHLRFTRSEIDTLLKSKRKLRREWQNQRSPNLKRQLTECTKKLQKLLKHNNERSFQNYVKNLSPSITSDYSLWKAAKNLNRPTNAEAPIRVANGDWARSDAEKGNAFAKHLKNVFTPNRPLVTHQLRRLPNALPTEPLRFTMKDLNLTIKVDLNPNKRPGYDQVTGRMVKELPQIAVRHLLYTFNCILRTGYYPEMWKLSQIIMVPKPGKDPTVVSSYRPISLLSILSKLFEKMLMAKIQTIAEHYRIVPEHQFGFRKKHGTTEQVHRLVSHIWKTFEEKQYCSAVFLDVAQAFDKVWHEGLVYKVRKLLPSNLHPILTSYLHNRKFVVKYKSFSSERNPINAGVPQGSVLGPFLYLLYTSDLLTCDNILTSTFADDTAFLFTSKDVITASVNLSNHLVNVEKWLSLWRIKINETKSSHITFTLNRDSCPAVMFNDRPIPQRTFFFFF